VRDTLCLSGASANVPPSAGRGLVFGAVILGRIHNGFHETVREVLSDDGRERRPAATGLELAPVKKRHAGVPMRRGRSSLTRYSSWLWMFRRTLISIVFMPYLSKVNWRVFGNLRRAIAGIYLSGHRNSPWWLWAAKQ
jgi:hypothetical protein